MCKACKDEIIAPPVIAATRRVLVHAGRLVGGVSAETRGNVSILIENDRILSVRDGFVEADGAQLVDLSEMTVLPGLIDCHVHLAYDASAGGPLALQFVTAARSTNCSPPPQTVARR